MLGVYYQTFMLAPPSYRRLASWTCGWLYVVGNITITLAVNFGTTLFFISCINIFETEPGVGIWEATTWQTFLTFLAITFLANATSSLGNRYLPYIDVRDVTPCLSVTMPTDVQTDCCHLLDVCRRAGHHHHRAGARQGWPPQRRVGLR